MTHDAHEIEETLAILQRLIARMTSQAYRGRDPYDALNSPLAPLLTLHTRWGRIALTQALRRSPVNFRRLLGIRRVVNPKALGLILESYVLLSRFARRVGNEELENALGREADAIARVLLTTRSPNASGAAWGYPFPWQNRYRLLPRNTPTVVNTSFISHALLDYYELSRDQDARISREQGAEARAAALTSARFILNDLRRDEEVGGLFSYTPLDANYVYNANFLGISLLARLIGRYDLDAPLDEIFEILDVCVAAQDDSGAWRYGTRAAQGWVDSFHTGFNLESLARILRYLGSESPKASSHIASERLERYRASFRRGVEYYATRFFAADGAPRYYADRVYLYDIHAPAEAIYFFSTREGRDEGLARIVTTWTLKNLYDRRRGYFYFRKTRFYTIKTDYLRWSQAWMTRALARRLATLAEEESTR